ncbi:MAG: PTS sugar transporter subunit IIC [Elusimicrobiota bacterium]|jgi:PTS system cellobiose-specific IIC component|nr:PTS sugar transporter subunit IIC [Elusimicrobiota bacterium]
MKDFLQQKLVPFVLKIVNFKSIQAIKNGMFYVMPLTIVGSIFLLLANFPWAPVVNLLASLGMIAPFNQIAGATFDIIALVAVVGIAYEYCKAENLGGALHCGIIALASFLILQDSFVITDAGLQISGVLDKGWLGGKGVIVAILVGLLAGKVYTFFLKRDIRIKLPAGVPEGIANSFSGLIPALATFVIAAAVYGIFKGIWNITFVEAIYKVIQIPLQGMTDSLGGAIVMPFAITLLWFFGVHGSSIVSGIMQPVLMANTLDNQAILDRGLELTVANGGHVVTQQFLDQFITVTGSGMTIGLVLFLVIFAKSRQNKTLGDLSVVPALFNINEPILFGVPIVLNPLMAVPFILTPVISAVVTYFALYVGLVPLFSAVMVPWTTPPIISGFIVGGWKTALLQLIVLSMSFFIYLPFIRSIDKHNLAVEKAAESQQ